MSRQEERRENRNHGRRQSSRNSVSPYSTDSAPKALGPAEPRSPTARSSACRVVHCVVRSDRHLPAYGPGVPGTSRGPSMTYRYGTVPRAPIRETDKREVGSSTLPRPIDRHSRPRLELRPGGVLFFGLKRGSLPIGAVPEPALAWLPREFPYKPLAKSRSRRAISGLPWVPMKDRGPALLRWRTGAPLVMR
jgi:hypothetical protein